MKNEEEIKDALNECTEIIEGDTPLELEDWAHWEGQRKSLKWVLGINEESVKKNTNLMKILEGATDETIKKAQNRLKEECGYGLTPKESAVKDDNLHQEQFELYGCTS